MEQNWGGIIIPLIESEQLAESSQLHFRDDSSSLEETFASCLHVNGISPLLRMKSKLLDIGP